jgi:hypothetical protein
LEIVRSLFLPGLGVIAGGMIALQSVLSSSLGLRVGNIGSGLVLTLVSVGTLLIMIAVFPSMADFSNLPGRAEWADAILTIPRSLWATCDPGNKNQLSANYWCVDGCAWSVLCQ